MVDQIIFIIVSIIMFILIFLKIIKKNDTGYVGLLVVQAVGIAIDFIFLLNNINMKFFVKLIVVLLSVIFPLTIIILEKYNINIIQDYKLLKVKFYLLIGNYKKAKNLLFEILDNNEHNYVAHKILAGIYEKEGGSRKAMEEYVQCININNKDFDLYFKISSILINLDRKDEAIELLKDLLKKKPDYPNATIALGDLLIEKGRYKEATSTLLEALKREPLNYDLNYSLGIAYTMLNDFKSAKECYEKAAEINSLAYNAKYYLGEIAMLYKDLDKAEKYFIEVLDSEDLCADSYFELAKIKLMRGDKDTAIKYSNLAIDLDSKRISDKIKKEPLFITIMTKISIPFNLEEKEDNKSFTVKELIAKEHLEKTQEITTNMGYIKGGYSHEIEKDIDMQIEK